MPRRSVQVELQEVPLKTRFRKMTGGRRDKVRDRAKVEVVQVGEEKFGVTVRRGVVSVKKGTIQGSNLTVASVRAAIRRQIKQGKYDSALFDDYEKIQSGKKAKAKKR